MVLEKGLSLKTKAKSKSGKPSKTVEGAHRPKIVWDIYGMKPMIDGHHWLYDRRRWAFPFQERWGRNNAFGARIGQPVFDQITGLTQT